MEASDGSSAVVEGEQRVANSLQLGCFTGWAPLRANIANQKGREGGLVQEERKEERRYGNCGRGTD